MGAKVCSVANHGPACDRRPRARLNGHPAPSSVGSSTTSLAISESRYFSVSPGRGRWWSGELSWRSRRYWKGLQALTPVRSANLEAALWGARWGAGGGSRCCALYPSMEMAGQRQMNEPVLDGLGEGQ
jgi:hypothetical protein